MKKSKKLFTIRGENHIIKGVAQILEQGRNVMAEGEMGEEGEVLRLIIASKRYPGGTVIW